MKQLYLLGLWMACLLHVEVNAMENDSPNINHYAYCRECTISKVWKIYKDFCHKQENRTEARWISQVCRADIQRLEDTEQVSTPSLGETYPEILNELKIELSFEKIKEIYEKHGVIQLRPIYEGETTLLIGCGNNPIDPHFLGHVHKGMITINPELSMNPTIIGAFGVDDLTHILPPQHFTKLVEESVNPIVDNIDMLRYSLDTFLKDGYAFYTINKKEQSVPNRDKSGYDQLDPIHENAFEYLTNTNF